MKKYLIFGLVALQFTLLLTSCSGSQLFLEARTTYNVPLDHDGNINKNIMESDARNASGFNEFNPQIRLTYRQYIFDGKKHQMKNIVKKQLKNYNIKQK
tara:strand:- start:24 stop:320 length:297 start_codon:yes stop_codon:yes gene_type:complete